MMQVVELALNPSFGANSLSARQLFQALVPKIGIDISDSIVLAIIGRLGKGSHCPSLATQNMAMQWLAGVYEWIGDTAQFSSYYGILFFYLGYMSLRQPISVLLGTITRRKHVLPYRVEKLLELQQSAQQDSSIHSLLSIYYDLRPDLFTQSITPRRFKIPAAIKIWRAHALQIRNESRPGGERKRTKIFKSVGIKPAEYLHEEEGIIPERDIALVKDAALSIGKIAIPQKAISSIASKIGLLIFAHKHQSIDIARIDLWLNSFLSEKANPESFKQNKALDSDVTDILEQVDTFCRRTSVSLSNFPLEPENIVSLTSIDMHPFSSQDAIRLHSVLGRRIIV